MNEKLKEFAAQAGFNLSGHWHCCDYELERFADLVRQDERDKCAQDYLQDCCDAVAVAEHNEREACAKIIEDYVEEGLMDGHALRAAKTIRARGEK